MTPTEKATELVNTMLDKLYANGSLSFKRILHAKAVECAIVTADEMIKIGWNLPHYDNLTGEEYWSKVKAELQGI